MDNNIQNITAWVLESEELDDLHDSDDSADDPDYIQSNEQYESESDVSDTECVVNEFLNSNERNRSSVSRRSRSRSPLSNTAPLPTYYLGKDNTTKWNIYGPPLNVRTRSHNIVSQVPGIRRCAKNAKSIIDCWSLFFPYTVIEEIVTCTNVYLAKIRVKYQREKDVLDTTLDEIKALLGLLYLAGYLRSRHLNLKDLWSNDGLAPEYFRAVMPEKRFYLLLRALRFDDVHTRNERLSVDKLAAIRTIFNGFVKRCQDCYTIGENGTIDEMLEAFRGKCNFRIYMPSKPSKYGIKIHALVDSKTFYTSNMEVYVGVQPDGPYKCENNPSSVVLRLIAPISKTGRNITMDNWYTSIPLANELLKSHKLTLVGTLRKNKREISPNFLETKKRAVYSSIFGYGKDILLTSYTPKKKKNVLLISTMHEHGVIDPESGDQKKPEVITYYNSTKGGVDVVDELKGEYSVARISCRWPLTIFFSLMNIAGINSQIIFRDNTNQTITRRLYLKMLGKELTKNFMEQRLQNKKLSIPLRQTISKLTGHVEEPTVAELIPDLIERQKCRFCPKRKNRKTIVRCDSCKSPICKEHTVSTCTACAKKGNESDSE